MIPTHLMRQPNTLRLLETLLDRNTQDGINNKMFSQTCIIFVYTIWDTEIRPAYATVLGIEQEQVSSDLFGDLRQLRNAILHSSGKLRKPLKRLTFLSVGESVFPRRPEMDRLFSMLFDELNSISKRFTDQGLPTTFERKLNPNK